MFVLAVNMLLVHEAKFGNNIKWRDIVILVPSIQNDLNRQTNSATSKIVDLLNIHIKLVPPVGLPLNTTDTVDIPVVSMQRNLVDRDSNIGTTSTTNNFTGRSLACLLVQSGNGNRTE